MSSWGIVWLLSKFTHIFVQFQFVMPHISLCCGFQRVKTWNIGTSGLIAPNLQVDVSRPNRRKGLLWMQPHLSHCFSLSDCWAQLFLRHLKPASTKSLSSIWTFKLLTKRGLTFVTSFCLCRPRNSLLALIRPLFTGRTRTRGTDEWSSSRSYLYRWCGACCVFACCITISHLNACLSLCEIVVHIHNAKPAK